MSDSRRARIHWCARVPSLLLTCSFPSARRWPAGAGRRQPGASPAPVRRFGSAQDARRPCFEPEIGARWSAKVVGAGWAALVRASRGVDGGHGRRAQNWADHMKARRKRSRERHERARKVQMSCLTAQLEKSGESISSPHTFVFRYSKAGKKSSLDLVLLSRDSTMSKIYPPLIPR